MRFLHVRGIEIFDDPSVPDGEIWLNCPMANGGKVRYMFNLTDHRMTQPGADKCFFLQMQEWLETLRVQMTIDGTTLSVTQLDLILAAMEDFKTGKDPRTVADDG